MVHNVLIFMQFPLNKIPTIPEAIPFGYDNVDPSL